MTLCVKDFFVNFYVLVLGEIHVRGYKIIEDHFCVSNARENIPKDQLRVLEKGPMLEAKTAQRQSTYRWQSTSSGLVDAP